MEKTILQVIAGTAGNMDGTNGKGEKW